MRRHRAGDRRARQTLIERHLPLARSLARRYRRTREPMDDLIQVASLGLIKAVDRWDPDRGLAFSTFAVPTILGELRRYFRDSTWVVRPPRELLELSLCVERLREPLGATLGSDPTAVELAERLGRPPEAIAEALRAGQARWTSPLTSGALEDAPSRPPSSRPRPGSRSRACCRSSSRTHERSCGCASRTISSRCRSRHAPAARRSTSRASSVPRSRRSACEPPPDRARQRWVTFVS